MGERQCHNMPAAISNIIARPTRCRFRNRGQALVVTLSHTAPGWAAQDYAQYLYELVAGQQGAAFARQVAFIVDETELLGQGQ